MDHGISRQAYIFRQPKAIAVALRVLEVQLLVKVKREILAGCTMLGIKTISYLRKCQPYSPAFRRIVMTNLHKFICQSLQTLIIVGLDRVIMIFKLFKI